MKDLIDKTIFGLWFLLYIAGAVVAFIVFWCVVVFAFWVASSFAAWLGVKW